MIFDVLTIGHLKSKIKDLSDDMPIYLDCEDDQGHVGVLSIKQKKVITYDDPDDFHKKTEIDALVLAVA